jgi:hypothetical protein
MWPTTWSSRYDFVFLEVLRLVSRYSLAMSRHLSVGRLEELKWRMVEISMVGECIVE